MQIHTFFFPELHKHGDSFASYLSLRKRQFVDELGWSLAHDGRHEMDQYDHPLAAYSIVSIGGKAVAGGRALSCSSDWMGWSYMLRDASLRKLPFIPVDLMEHYPEQDTHWECTRLVIDNSNLDSGARALVLKAVVFGLCDITSRKGGQWLLSLSPVSFGRLLRSMGYDAVPVGRKYTGVEDGRAYRAFKMPSDPSVNRSICAPLLSGHQQHTGADALLERLLVTAA